MIVKGGNEVTIKVMIAEDERLTREELAFFILQEKDFLLCPSAENGIQLLELYQQYLPDVIFLDIHMPSMSGMDAAIEIVKRNQETGRLNPLFVFCTAYEEYAIGAFTIEAIDYLLKPYDHDRFKLALTRVYKQFHYLNQSSRIPSPSIRGSKLLIEDGERVVVLSPESIQYAVKMDRTVEIHTDKGKINTKMTLQELENKLIGFSFFRTHRSYLVNLEYVDEIIPWFNGAYNLQMKNNLKVKIPVSRVAARELFRILGE